MSDIGLDFGSRTVGVAVSDPLGLTAQGLEIIDVHQKTSSAGHLPESKR